MGIRWVQLALDHGPQDSTQRFALVALAESAHNDTGVCWLAVPTIARRICKTERHTQKVLRALETDGWTETVLSRGGRAERGKYVTNTYRICAERFQRAAIESPSNPVTHDGDEPDPTPSPTTPLRVSPTTLNPVTHDTRTVIEPSREPATLPPQAAGRVAPVPHESVNGRAAAAVNGASLTHKQTRSKYPARAPAAWPDEKPKDEPPTAARLGKEPRDELAEMLAEFGVIPR